MAVFDGLPTLARAAALGGHARRADRMAATLGAAFTTTVRMVDRVHRRAADVRANALPAIAAGLADDDVHRVGIADLADRRPAARRECGGFRRWAA